MLSPRNRKLLIGNSFKYLKYEIVFLKSTTERGGASKDDFSLQKNTSGSEKIAISYFKTT